MLSVNFELNDFWSVCIITIYSNLYFLTKLNANDLMFIPVHTVDEGQTFQNNYLWYRKFYICRYTTQKCEHKNALRIDTKVKLFPFLNLYFILHRL